MIAIDLFAGIGWGMACKALGIREFGVEIMPEAVETRRLNGLETPERDVWIALAKPRGHYDMLIASPPCQTFSMAGIGAGRRALDEVLLALYELVRTGDVDELREFGARHDDRTALVLAPLAWIQQDRPRIVVLEQVPTVQPVWEAYADVLRSWGYSVDTRILHAEQYGVPQTRRRSILVARNDGVPVALPTPTHSRYYPRDPKRLDPGVKPWVSMAEALGWGMTERPYPTIASARSTGGPDKEKVGGSAARAVIYAEQEAGRWAYERPATTVVGSFNPDVISAPGYRTAGGHSRQNEPGSIRVSMEQAARLQSFPDGMQWAGSKSKKFMQIGNAVPPGLAWAILKVVLA